MRVAVIDANERPYDRAKVVERKSGLYASYFATFSVESSLMILVTSYVWPKRSNDVRDEILCINCLRQPPNAY